MVGPEDSGIIALGLVVYFVPTIVAYVRGIEARRWVFFCNLVGFSGFTWILAMAAAMIEPGAPPVFDFSRRRRRRKERRPALPPSGMTINRFDRW